MKLWKHTVQSLQLYAVNPLSSEMIKQINDNIDDWEYTIFNDEKYENTDWIVIIDDRYSSARLNGKKVLQTIQTATENRSTVDLNWILKILNFFIFPIDSEILKMESESAHALCRQLKNLLEQISEEVS